MTYSFFDFATEVLKTAAGPLTPQQIWQAGKSKGLNDKLKTVGKTPWDTIASLLYVTIRDDPASIFIRVAGRPARFFLRARVQDLKADIFPKI